MWWMYALLSALFASLTAVFAKAGVVTINSNLATCIRTFVILILTCTVTLLRGDARGIGALSKQGVYSLLISGVATGLSWLFYFKAIQVGKLSQVAPVDKLSVALTILLAIIFLGETLTLKMAIGAGLIIAGTVVLVWP